MALIELKNISKTYKVGNSLSVKALSNITLNVEKGDFIALMGPSGSGKSTLMAILGLLDKPDSGSYKLNGKEISKLSNRETAVLRNKFFGFIFQSFNLLPRLNILTNVLLPFIYSEKGITKDNKDKVKNLLKRVGMEDRIFHSSNEISGGQQQKAAVVRAIANDPLVILADEPTGNLDSKSTEEIMNLLSELNQSGNTIIMVTHNPELSQYASKVVKLKDGMIVEQTTLKPQNHLSERNYNLPEIKAKSKKILNFDSFNNYAKEAIISLGSNKLRSFLSIIGVMIGVAAVIAMLALGTGAKKQVEQSLSNLGTNTLTVFSSRRSQGGISLGSGTITQFDFEDLSSLKRIYGVKNVVPYVNGRVQAVFNNKNWNTSIVGTDVEYAEVKNSFPTSGRFFTKDEVATRAKVAVIGSNIVKQLFENEYPIGKNIKINRINFKVIGVLPEKGQAGFQNLDDQIIIPISTAMYRVLGVDYISRFDVQGENENILTEIENEIPKVLGKNHRLQESQYDQIEVRNMADIQKAMSESVQALNYLLGSIAAVSLLVGGIGIMNIMLVIVMERTREIGLRKALGAQENDILIQFLIEGSLICTIGGVIGILLGAIISFGLSAFFGWNTYISAGSIVLAFGFSIATGIIFSLWPARRASKLLPIEALRYE